MATCKRPQCLCTSDHFLPTYPTDPPTLEKFQNRFLLQNPAPQQEGNLPQVELWEEQSTADRPSIADCTPPAVGEPGDPAGCALFSGTIITGGFTQSGSELTPEGRQALDEIAVLMRRHAEVTIELRSHTRAFDAPATANRIARERVLNAARHLNSRGVPVARLRARAFGNAVPPERASTSEDRLELAIVP